MSDYRVSVKVRNNNILRAIEAAGFTSIPVFAAAYELNYVSLNNLINMTISPVDNGAEWKPLVVKLCDALHKMPVELFSREQMVALETNKGERECDAETVYAIMNQQTLPDELPQVIADALKKLRPREEQVLRGRFGFDGPIKTLNELGEEIGINKERVRQIETKALRKLRNVSRCKSIVDAMDNYIYDPGEQKLLAGETL